MPIWPPAPAQLTAAGLQERSLHYTDGALCRWAIAWHYDGHAGGTRAQKQGPSYESTGLWPIAMGLPGAGFAHAFPLGCRVSSPGTGQGPNGKGCCHLGPGGGSCACRASKHGNQAGAPFGALWLNPRWNAGRRLPRMRNRQRQSDCRSAGAQPWGTSPVVSHWLLSSSPSLRQRACAIMTGGSGGKCARSMVTSRLK